MSEDRPAPPPQDEGPPPWASDATAGWTRPLPDATPEAGPPPAAPSPPAPPAAGWAPGGAPRPGWYDAAGNPPPPGQLPPGQPPAGYPPAPGWGGYPAGYPAYGYAPPTEQRAVWALVAAIAGWVVCPIILHVVGLLLANQSLQAIRTARGSLEGQGMAQAARIVSIIGLLFYGALFAFFLVALVVAISASNY